MERPPQPVSVVLAIALAALSPACALAPPVRSSGALAKRGVRVAVVGQRCAETVEPEWPEASLVEERVAVEVRNDDAAPVTVRREDLRLLGPDGRQVPGGGWSAHEPVSIAPGQSETFDVVFMTRGGLSCTQPMRLDADSGVTLGSAPIPVGVVTFTPSRP